MPASASDNPIITTTVTQAIALKAREFVYFPMRRFELTRRSMKIRMNGSRTPFATCERKRIRSSGALGSRTMTHAPTIRVP